MKFDFDRLDDLNARLTLVIERSDYTPKLEENLKNYSKKLNIKGFRAGKTPKTVLTKMYGKGMMEETIVGILNEKIRGYLDEGKIDIFGSPMIAEDSEPIDFNPKEPRDYTFRYDLGLKPAFNLSYEFETPLSIRTAATDQNALDADILRYRRAFGAEEPILDGVVEPHDRVTLVMNRILEDGSVEETNKEAVVDLERIKGEANSSLPGLKVGASMDADLEKFFGYARPMLIKNTLGLEEDPHPDHPLNYRLVIEKIGRPQATELTGEQLTKYVGPQIEDEAGFRKMLEDRENSSNQVRTNDMKKLVIRNTLLQANHFHLPEEFLLKWVNSQRDQKIEAGSREAKNLFREAGWSLLLNKISTEAGLEVTEKDIQKQVTNWIMENVNYRQTDIRKLMKELYANEYFMSTMKENALEEVVFTYLIPKYQFEETGASAEEFEHAFHDLHHQLFDHGEHSHGEYH